MKSKNQNRVLYLTKMGFTLVELLAVIVVLAIILLIAIPKVNNILYSYEKKTFMHSATSIISMAEKIYQTENIGSLNPEGILYNIKDGQIFNNDIPADFLEGKIDGNGFVQVNTNGQTKITFSNDKFCAKKEFEESVVTVVANTTDLLCKTIYVPLKVELNGGTSSQKFSDSYLENTIIKLERPIKTNNGFVEWQVVKGNSVIEDNILTIGNTETEIWALLETYPTLTVNLGEGASTEQDFATSYKSGTIINLIEPTREGYTFAGWTVTDGNGYVSGNIFTMGTRDTTLTANWTINTYTITYNLDGGTHGSSAPTSGTYGETVTVSNPTKTGYTFDGWAVSGTNASMKDTNLTIGAGNITLTANWAINTYTITYNLDGGTHGSYAPTSGTYGETVTVSNPTKTGYRFTEWTVEGALMSDTNLTIGASNVTLTANWELNSLIESYSCANGNAGTEPYNFTYTGNCTVIDDGNDNWRVKFLTSGTFTTPQDVTIDAFLVGGGGGGSAGKGGGGGGGFTTTKTNITLQSGKSYTITVGDGGDSGTDGGESTAFGVATAAGGHGANYNHGGDIRDGGAGGSGGGGGYTGSTRGGNGGSDGRDGGAGGTNIDGKNAQYSGGAGQGTTTREFGEASGTLYSGGGGGATYSSSGTSGGSGGGGASATENGGNGGTNTGGGGGGCTNGSGGSGGSGIVVIRNAR